MEATSPTSSLEESVADTEMSVADIERALAKYFADVERVMKDFCVQEGKGECVDKVGAWVAACSGPDMMACTSAQAALDKCMQGNSS